MNRVVSYDTVLGLHDKCFKLKKGEEIKELETNQYGRVRIFIRGKFESISKPMLERISNEQVDIEKFVPADIDLQILKRIYELPDIE